MQKTGIVIHHWGSDSQGMTPESFVKTANEISKAVNHYHVQISPFGQIYQTEEWEKVIGHAGNQKLEGDIDTINRTTIGICFAGNFMQTQPTEKARFAFHCVLDRITVEYKRALNIYLHKEISFTDCPGLIDIKWLTKTCEKPRFVAAPSGQQTMILKNGRAYIQLQALQSVDILKDLVYDYARKIVYAR
jgi:hypothetical protein